MKGILLLILTSGLLLSTLQNSLAQSCGGYQLPEGIRPAGYDPQTVIVKFRNTGKTGPSNTRTLVFYRTGKAPQ